MNAVKSVIYNNGEADLFAIVLSDAGDHKLNLLAFDANTGTPTVVNDVPRRDKADYGPEGGGKTYHV